MFEVEHAGVGQNVQLTDAFVAIGYRVYRYVPGLGALVPLDAGSGNVLNLFACKSDRAACLAARGLLLLELPGEMQQPGALIPTMPVRFASFPYVRALQERWKASHAGAAAGERVELEAVIAAFHMSKDRSLALDRRYSALRDSYTRALALCQAGTPRLRCMTFLRVEREFLNSKSASAATRAFKLLQELNHEGSMAR